MKKQENLEVEILRLKVLKSDLEAAEQQQKEGTTDLNFRLSFFRKKVSESQLSKFDSMFFPHLNEQSSKNEELKVLNEEDVKSSPKNKINKKPKWLKKIYRETVTRTHPDKFQNFDVEEIKKKYLKIYLDTIESWNKNKDGFLLVCAAEASVEIDHKDAIGMIEKDFNSASKEIEHYKSLTGYQWFHQPEEVKELFLENYLKQLGFEFTKEKIKEVLRKVSNRKAGQKPTKGIANKRSVLRANKS